MPQLVIPLPHIVFTLPQGTSSLPMVEIDKAKVHPKNKHIRLRKDSMKRQMTDCSFGAFISQLDFTAWQFFHAAKKTELASSFTNVYADRRAFAFALEHENTFIWNTGNFRKKDSSVFALEDFASEGFAGRIGEAVAYLTMIKWGYVFWDRCATVWERAARSVNITHPEQLRVAQYLSSRVASGRPKNEPDFIFEQLNGGVALMEAKGSFVNPTKDNPSTKTDLQQALNQIAAWSDVIAPTPQKNYGIGTYLREEHDSNGDPSLIAYVDPPGQDKPDIRPFDLPPDLVRRCNYGAWLVGMRLASAGHALSELREKNIEAIELPIIEVDGRRFAITLVGWRTARTHVLRNIDPWLWKFNLQPDWPQDGILVMGIEQGVMRLIAEALRKPNLSVLREQLDGQGLTDLQKSNRDYSWSIMPDGSFLGILDVDTIEHGFRNMEKFLL